MTILLKKHQPVNLKKEGSALLCHIGTNGELALQKGGALDITSTAAGSAFEGKVCVNPDNVKALMDAMTICAGYFL